MRDIRPGTTPLEILLGRWNKQPDQVRTRRLGIAKGVPFNSFAARQRLPFKLPAGAKLEEDGSISRRKPR